MTASLTALLERSGIWRKIQKINGGSVNQVSRPYYSGYKANIHRFVKFFWVYPCVNFPSFPLNVV